MRHGRKQGHPVRVGGRVVALASAAAIAAALAAPAEALAGGAALYRLYNPYDGQHLLTRDAGEYESLQPLGWRGEGEAWEAPAEGDPVYRLYNPYSGEHLYTGDEAEYGSLPGLGWRQEGVAFRSEGPGGDPVYRLFNPYASVGTHLLTTDRAEYESLQPLGWRGEGVAFYADAHAHLGARLPEHLGPGLGRVGRARVLDRGQVQMLGLRKDLRLPRRARRAWRFSPPGVLFLQHQGGPGPDRHHAPRRDRPLRAGRRGLPLHRLRRDEVR